MPPVAFQVGHMRESLPSDQVALLLRALDEQQRGGEEGRAVAEIARRIRAAAAQDPPESEAAVVGRDVALALVDVISMVERDGRAPEELRSLRLHARVLLADIDVFRAQVQRLLAHVEALLRPGERGELGHAIDDRRNSGVAIEETAPGLEPRALDLGNRLLHHLEDADRELNRDDVHELEQLVRERLEHA